MKLLNLTAMIALATALTACGGLPKECEESWKHMEDLAKQSGIPEDSLKEQKKAFEEEIKKCQKKMRSKHVKHNHQFLVWLNNLINSNIWMCLYPHPYILLLFFNPKLMTLLSFCINKHRT